MPFEQGFAADGSGHTHTIEIEKISVITHPTRCLPGDHRKAIDAALIEREIRTCQCAIAIDIGT